MPPIMNNLTKGRFYSGDLGERGLEHEPKHVPCWSMLVTGLPGVMCTMLSDLAGY